MSDALCDERGVPSRLHTLDKPRLDPCQDGEFLYRRFKKDQEVKLEAAISFNRRESSTCWERLCEGPEDALLKCEEVGGGRFDGQGILKFPADIFIEKVWDTEEKTPVQWVVSVIHDPTRCNYAHTDFRYHKDGSPAENLTPTSLKKKIRSFLSPYLEIVLSAKGSEQL